MASTTLTKPSTFSTVSSQTTGTWKVDTIRNTALLSLITLLATVLRFHAISAKSFWFDEAVSAEITRLPWSQFFIALWNREANMVLYYLLLHFWLFIGGTEGFIRSLSVIFSVATVPVVFALGRRLYGPRTGLLAAWFLAINAYHVRYAQEARSYSLVVLLASVATWLLVRNLQEPASASWQAYTAVCVLMVYSHFFGGLVVVAHFIALALMERENVPWRAFLRSMGRFTFLVIPVAVFVAERGVGPINWVPKARPDVLLNFAFDLSGNGGFRLLTLDAIALGAGAFGCWKLWSLDGRTLKNWMFSLPFVWLVAPVLIVLAASLIQPLFVPRYLNPCLPAFVLMVAAGVTQLRPTFLAWILGAAISVASLGGTISYYHQDFDVGRNDWPGVASFVFDHAQPGDGVFFYLNLGRVPFEFFRSQRHPFQLWPKALDSEGDGTLTYRDFEFSNLGESLRDARPAGDRVWLVLIYDTDPDGKPNRASIMARAVYAKGRHLVESRNFSGITVLLYSKDATANAGATLGKL